MTRDSQNRMTSCTLAGATSTFTYGADGLRRSMTAGGQTTNYAYDGQTMLREMRGEPGSLHATATYLSGPRGPEYRRDDTQTEPDGQGHTFGRTRWYVYDGLGSVVGEVDPAGNVTCSDRYDVYGAVRGRAGMASTAHGFVGSLGHLSDAATGLVYMRARYYDPGTGGFVSQDPARSGGNWFAYCSGNPVNLTDATGKDGDSIGKDVADFGLGCLLSKTFLAAMAIGFLSLLCATVVAGDVALGACFGPGGLVYGGLAAYYSGAAIIKAIGVCYNFAVDGANNIFNAEKGAWGAIGLAKEAYGICEGYQAGLSLFMKADDFAQDHNM